MAGRWKTAALSCLPLDRWTTHLRVGVTNVQPSSQVLPFVELIGPMGHFLGLAVNDCFRFPPPGAMGTYATDNCQS